jgi:hypothetical protein
MTGSGPQRIACVGAMLCPCEHLESHMHIDHLNFLY